jgi:uncharacterized membrane protein YqaE (UPF0057 family)
MVGSHNQRDTTPTIRGESVVRKLPVDYLLAILLPPVAVLLKGKPLQAALNLLLTLCFWIPGMIHAILVVNNANAEKRNRKLVKAIRQGQQIS